MSRTVLDLDSPQSWPKELLAHLDKHHEFFLQWENDQAQPFDFDKLIDSFIPSEDHQGQSSSQEYDQVCRGLRRVLQPYDILGWHCTRLTDFEAAEIQSNGVQLPNARMLARRIDALSNRNCINRNIARHFKCKNQADHNNRAGRVWFCFFPPWKQGEHGIGKFFRYWGGEALYRCHEDDLVTSSALSSIGTARIVEADVPIALLREFGYLEPNIYRRYLISRGACNLPLCDYEDCIVHPLPAENVRCIISFPEPDFCSLTHCSDWDNPIPNNQPDTNCA